MLIRVAELAFGRPPAFEVRASPRAPPALVRPTCRSTPLHPPARRAPAARSQPHLSFLCPLADPLPGQVNGRGCTCPSRLAYDGKGVSVLADHVNAAAASLPGGAAAAMAAAGAPGGAAGLPRSPSTSSSLDSLEGAGGGAPGPAAGAPASPGRGGGGGAGEPAKVARRAAASAAAELEASGGGARMVGAEGAKGLTPAMG
jgi:hypothetical protein